ncbi:MAG TPA: hypothetical protein VN969_01280 [Streptosporangiaceae bacterium]|nr:hypothetical protein [Streptosporangiaceae bacterium]
MRRSWLFLGAVAACGTGLLTGCSASHSASSGTCGSTSTAAGVPVIIEVAKGDVSCSTALSIETKYAALIKSGNVRGTGGGAPVPVSGWTCQGYSTPQILQTGDASQCHTPTAEILAVLPTPTTTPTP